MELFIYLGKSAAILTLFYLVYIFLLRRDTLFTANRHYLLAGIIASIIFPLVEFTKTIYVAAPLRTPIAISEVIPDTRLIVQETTTINWWYVPIIIYSIGVLYMLFRFVNQLYSLSMLLKKYPSEKVGNYTYIKVPQNSAPFSFFKHIVFNPEIHSQEELSMVLKHEQIHGAQWHSMDILLTNIFLIFQWMNPFAWLYKKGIEENLEFIADSETVQQISSVKQYQLALVKASSTFPIPSLTNNFYQSFIKKRILMLNKSSTKKINIWKLSVVLPLLAIFLWSFNVNEVIEYTKSENASVLSLSSEKNMTSPSEIIHKEVQTTSEVPVEIITLTSEETSKRQAEPIAKVTSETKTQTKERIILTQDTLLTITKDTTKEELDAMKTELGKMGFSFDYSSVDFNDNNEIIAISISYTDANGNSGMYNTNSGTPINTIIIKSNGKSISVRSVGNGSYSYDRSDDQETILEARRVEREERREEMKERMEERKEEMEERRETMQEEMEEQRSEMRAMENEKREEMRHEMKERQKEEREVMREGRKIEREKMRERMREERLSTMAPEDLKRITMNTTDAELDQIKREFKERGVSFSYSRIKRNSNGEITQIRLKLNNNNGSDSHSSYNGDGKGIKTILIGSNAETTIMTTKAN